MAKVGNYRGPRGGELTWSLTITAGKASPVSYMKSAARPWAQRLDRMHWNEKIHRFKYIWLLISHLLSEFPIWQIGNPCVFTALILALIIYLSYRWTAFPFWEIVHARRVLDRGQWCWAPRGLQTRWPCLENGEEVRFPLPPPFEGLQIKKQDNDSAEKTQSAALLQFSSHCDVR